MKTTFLDLKNTFSFYIKRFFVQCIVFAITACKRVQKKLEIPISVDWLEIGYIIPLPRYIYNKYVRKMTDFEEERIDTYSTDLDEIFTQYS